MKKGDKVMYNYQEEYVSLESAKLLKEKGFVEGSQAFYDLSKNGEFVIQTSLYVNGLDERFIEAPTLWEAQKWIRDNLYKSIEMYSIDQSHYSAKIKMYSRKGRTGAYEEALDKAIKTALL